MRSEVGRRSPTKLTARSKDSHHLPWLDATRDIIQDGLIVGDLAISGTSLEEAEASASARYGITDIAPFERVTSSLPQRA